MDTNKYYLPCIVVLASILFWCKPASAQDFDKVEIKKVKITDNIYMLKGRGGNIGVSIGEDGVFLVDDQYAPLSKKIKIAISEISDKPIDFVLNTHWHYDHTGGNEPLGEVGALIVSHENTRKRLTGEQFIAFFKKKQAASPKIALPVVTFANSITFHLNGEEIHAFHVESAHTDGDAVVYFKRNNVVHMGDIYFAGGYPFIDIPNGGTVNGVINVVRHVLDITDEDTKFIPGHGPLSSRNELVSYKDMLVAIRDGIQAQIKQKKTLEEIIDSKPTKEFDEANKTFIPVEGFIKILYQDLSRDSQ